MKALDQRSTPLFDALKKYADDRVIQFHVPGHKQGRGIPELKDYFGEQALRIDANGMADIDYFNNPNGVIAEAQELLAEAYQADKAYFLVNGTTSGIQAMIMSACSPGNEIIVPRNAHKSVISGIILSGAVPVYVEPAINKELGIAMGVTVETMERAIMNHPNAKAVFVINPTYYGIASDLSKIAELAHSHGMAVLADEAHGAHMYFNEAFPLPAMKAGADMSATSIHKTGGSLTQSSALLFKSNIIPPGKVKQILNLLSTSSASYLLLCSLDVARKQLVAHGKALLDGALLLARLAREEINNIEGLRAFGNELIGTPGCFAFDETKLSINISRLGVTGYQMETLLRKDYNIQVEFSDIYNFLAVVSIGDREEDLCALTGALRDLSHRLGVKKSKSFITNPFCPELVVSPRTAFYSPKKSVEFERSEGHIAGEMVLAYPPGIPVINIGERITRDVIEYIKVLKSQNCELQGTSDPDINFIKVLC